MITKQPENLTISPDRRRFLQTSGALGLAAASGTIPQIVYAQDKKILKMRTYADMRSLDPAHSQGIVDEEIQSSIYSKLIQYKPGREWGWELDAAESIEQADDTHIKFKLKQGVMFTNGYGEMTAEDVKYSFERILDEKIESTNTPDWGSLKEVTVDGKYEGTIVFDEPYPPAWNIALTYIVGNIISKKAWEEAGGRSTLLRPAPPVPICTRSGNPSKKPSWCATRIGTVAPLPSTRYTSFPSMMKILPRSRSNPVTSTIPGCR